MSGANKRANGRASGPVLTSRFLLVPDHSAAVAVGDGAAVAVAIGEEIARKEAEEDAEAASPKEKELLHAAREQNKPRRVAPDAQAKIERKILPLTPDDATR